MRYLLATYFLLLFINSSCQKITLRNTKVNNVTVRTWQITVTPPPAAYTGKYLFVFIGESNSGGYAANANATSAELAQRNKTYILNNNTFSFEPLDIGTNNNIGHVGLPNREIVHGWELQIANLVDSNYLDSTWIVKTGQGGSNYFHWQPNNTYTSGGISVQPYNEAIKRIDSAIIKSGIDSLIFFFSLGINSAGANHDTAVVRTGHQNLINNLRARYGNAPFVITKVPNSVSNFSGINASLERLVPLGKVYLVETDDISRGDALHYNYAGMKVLARRMIDKFVEAGYNIKK